MEDPFDAHNDESLDNLFEYSENFLNAQLFIFLFVVVKKVPFLTVFHYYLQLFAFLVEVGVVYLYQVWMDELLHYFYFLQCLIALERVYMNALEGKGSLLAVLDQIYTAEATFADRLD